MTTVSVQEKISDWLIIGIFFMIISLSPLLTILQPEKTRFSDTEKRRLAPLPQLSLDNDSLGKIPVQFDVYIQDHFGLREWYINRYQREMQKRFGSSGTDAVITGKNNWYYFASESQMRDLEGRGYVSPGDLNLIKSSLRSRKKWLYDSGIAHLFFIAPNKQSIYPEFLPDVYQRTFTTTQLDNIVSHVNSSDEKLLLDLRSGLLEKKELYRLYNRTDSHWNALGASAAFGDVVKELEELFPGVPFQHGYKFFGTWLNGFRGDLAVMADLPDSATEETPLVKGVPLCSQKEPFKEQKTLDEQNFPVHPYITKCGNNGLKAIVFYDSFLEAMEPLVSVNFSQVLYVRGYFDQKLAQLLIAEFQPDIVLEELVERDLGLIY